MSSSKRPYIGGQAVIEGVMMRAPAAVSVAVRRPDGTLVVRHGPLEHSGGSLLRPMRSRFFSLPGLRGIATLIESLSLGYRALQFSADQQLAASGLVSSSLVLRSLTLRTLALLPVWLATFSASSDDDGSSSRGSSDAATSSGGSSTASSAGRGAMILATVFALGLFIALPQGLATLVAWLLGVELGLDDWRFQALTGAFKLVIITAYMLALSQFEELRRVFQYHGAEHKTIHAYEAGEPIDVPHVRAQSTLQARCGTTFLITVVIVSVIIGSIITPLVLPGASGILGWLATLVLRISLLPIIAAVSYELQRLSAQYCTTGPLRVLLWPGFAFQRITTRQPDDRQIEVAIAAMQSAMWRDDDLERAAQPERVNEFGSLESLRAHFAR